MKLLRVFTFRFATPQYAINQTIVKREELKTNMQIDKNIRPVIPTDISSLKSVIEATDLFPSNMLDEMIFDYFNNKNSNDLWLTYEDNQPIAIAS